MNKRLKLIEQKFTVPCETYGCNQRATRSIGNPQGPPNTYMHICEDCYESLKESMMPQQEEEAVMPNDNEIPPQSPGEGNENPGNAEGSAGGEGASIDEELLISLANTELKDMGKERLVDLAKQLGIEFDRHPSKVTKPEIIEAIEKLIDGMGREDNGEDESTES